MDFVLYDGALCHQLGWHFLHLLAFIVCFEYTKMVCQASDDACDAPVRRCFRHDMR